MKRVVRSSWFAFYGSFCGLGAAIMASTILLLAEYALFGQIDARYIWRIMTPIGSVLGFAVGIYYSLKVPPPK